MRRPALPWALRSAREAGAVCGRSAPAYHSPVTAARGARDGVSRHVSGFFHALHSCTASGLRFAFSFLSFAHHTSTPRHAPRPGHTHAPGAALKLGAHVTRRDAAARWPHPRAHKSCMPSTRVPLHAPSSLRRQAGELARHRLCARVRIAARVRRDPIELLRAR